MQLTNILDLLDIFSQNYVQFNNTIIISDEGLIIGNPLSPSPAEIFMSEIEQKKHKHQLMNTFKFLHIYVDDISACFTGTHRQLITLLELNRTIHLKIKFSTELKQEYF